MGHKRTRSSSSLASVNSEDNNGSDNDSDNGSYNDSDNGSDNDSDNDSYNGSDNDSDNEPDNEPDDSSVMDQNLLNRRHLHICMDAAEDLVEDCDDNAAAPAVSVVVRNMRAIAVSAFNVSAVYLFWVALHFVTAQLYVRYCAFPSLYGLLVSPFLISAPHCVAMRWVFTKGGTLIEGMWILFGTWMCSKVIRRDV